MFNTESSNTIITFYGGTRGNFIRCCLTLSDDTADASFKNSDYEQRLSIYKENVTQTPKMIPNEPWGPAHMDTYFNYDDSRIINADYSSKYIHCGHLHQIPSNNNIENTGLNNIKFINITMSLAEIDNIKKNLNIYSGTEEINRYSDTIYLEKFFKIPKWYNIPHDDILIKERFLEHCYNIDNKCFIDKISEYYDVYYDVCISKDDRF